MNLKSQRRIAASLLKVGSKRVWFDEDRLSEIKESITKSDIRKLIGDKAIQAKPVRATSKSKIRKRRKQKLKGRRKGHGSRKGKKGARLRPKKIWVAKVRLQRRLLNDLKMRSMLSSEIYRSLRMKVKGGFFRSVRHLKLYLSEHNLIQQKKK